MVVLIPQVETIAVALGDRDLASAIWRLLHPDPLFGLSYVQDLCMFATDHWGHLVNKLHALADVHTNHYNVGS